MGLYYYKARMYNPTLGRFMQTDPIGYKDDMDLYAYVHDDPVDGVDPSGLDDIVLFRPLHEAGMEHLADHTALLTGDDKTGWVYQSKDGAVGSDISGPPKYTTASFSARSAALQAASNLGYKSAESHSASPAQDKATRAGFDKAARSRYNLFNHDGGNCGDAANKGATAGGVTYNSSMNPKSQLRWAQSAAGNKAGWTSAELPKPNSQQVPLTQLAPGVQRGPDRVHTHRVC